MFGKLNSTHRTQSKGTEQILGSIAKMEDAARLQESSAKVLAAAVDKLRRAG
jgi:hypothetical protein